MKHMVAQIKSSGAEPSAHSARDRAEIVRLLKAGHTTQEVAWAYDMPLRNVRRIAKRAGVS